MKYSAIILALGVLFASGCQQENPGGSDTTPPSGGATTTGTASTEPDVNISAAGPTFSAVQPILAKNCVKCHGASNPKEGINLSSLAGVMKGGEPGKIVNPGDPDKSLIVDVLHGRNGEPQMPPVGGPIPAADIKTIEDWIRGGAKA